MLHITPPQCAMCQPMILNSADLNRCLELLNCDKVTDIRYIYFNIKQSYGFRYMDKLYTFAQTANKDVYTHEEGIYHMPLKYYNKFMLQ